MMAMVMGCPPALAAILVPLTVVLIAATIALRPSGPRSAEPPGREMELSPPDLAIESGGHAENIAPISACPPDSIVGSLRRVTDEDH